MALDYPWSLLEIEPTSEEKAIRRAYAVKLKVTRPDEDAAAFQALVEARDVALHLSRFISRDDDVEATNSTDVEVAAPMPAAQQDKAIDIGREPRVLVDVPLPGIAAFETRGGGRVEDVGYVDLPESLPLGEAVEESDEESDVQQLLDEVGKPHPWRDLKAQWSDVFDALERTSLAEYPEALWRVLNQLVRDLARDVNQLPDVSTRDADPSTYGEQLLGRYRDILVDLESRFGFLHQDTMLFDYLDDEKARGFINALTIAVGRARAEQQPHLREINVESVNPAYVQAAWASDDKMRAYYQTARETDSFPTAFSWLALLFPLPFALYYRLYGVAAFAAILSGANAIVQIMKSRGGEVPIGNMALTVYVITALAFAFNWQRIRLHALGREANRLTAKGLNSSEIEEKLRVWGLPSRAGMYFGVAGLVLIAAARAHFR